MSRMAEKQKAGSRLSRGFTLLELLLAVTLLALLLAGAYSGIQTSVRAMHSGEKMIERIDRVRTVQEGSFMRAGGINVRWSQVSREVSASSD